MPDARNDVADAPRRQPVSIVASLTLHDAGTRLLEDGGPIDAPGKTVVGAKRKSASSGLSAEKGLDAVSRCPQYGHRDEAALKGHRMSTMEEAKNKSLVLEAFDTLFNKRDYAKAESFWSPDYIQHSAHVAPGRTGLFDLVKSAPATLKHEPGLIVANDDYVILHGRFSGHGQPRN